VPWMRRGQRRLEAPHEVPERRQVDGVVGDGAMGREVERQAGAGMRAHKPSDGLQRQGLERQARPVASHCRSRLPRPAEPDGFEEQAGVRHARVAVAVPAAADRMVRRSSRSGKPASSSAGFGPQDTAAVS